MPRDRLDEGGVARDDVVTSQQAAPGSWLPGSPNACPYVRSMSGAESVERAVVAWFLRSRELVWRLVVTTVASCLRYRVTGLAAEAAFFAVLSVPPLIFALAGAIGYVSDQFTRRPGRATSGRPSSTCPAGRSPTAPSSRIITPTIDDVLEGGRFDVISLGFVLALWSGSRALNVFVDTITIMHGLGGHRGIVKTRALSFLLYVLAMVTGVVSIPLVVAGPSLVEDWLPRAGGLPERLLLAGRRRRVHLLPRDALPRVRAGADQLELQPARRDVLAVLLDRRLLPAALVPHRHRRPTPARSTARSRHRSRCCSGSTWSRSRC